MKNKIRKYAFPYQIGSDRVVRAVDRMMWGIQLPDIVLSELTGYVETQERGVYVFEGGIFKYYVDYVEWCVEIHGRKVFLVPRFSPDYSSKEAWKPDLGAFRIQIGTFRKTVVDADKLDLREVLVYRYYFKEELRPIRDLF